jgi:hypothetical protein
MDKSSSSSSPPPPPDSRARHEDAKRTAADRKDRLVRALGALHWRTVDELGWNAVLVTLKRGWSKTLEHADSIAYAQALGHLDPVKLVRELAALIEAGELRYRPAPAELAAILAERAVHDQAPVVDRAVVDSERAAAVNAAVAAALALGESECECHPRPVDWTKDGRGVLRHDHPLAPGCGGLGIGQVDDATAWAEAEHASSSADR